MWEIQSHLSSSFPVFGGILWGLYQLYLHFRCRARCAEVIEAIGFGVPQALAAGPPVGNGLDMGGFSLSRLVIGPYWALLGPWTMIEWWTCLGWWGFGFRIHEESDHCYLSRQIIAMVLCGFVWAADGAELLLLGCLAEPGCVRHEEQPGVTSLSWPCYLDRSSIWYRSI